MGMGVKSRDPEAKEKFAEVSIGGSEPRGGSCCQLKEVIRQIVVKVAQ